jgi:ureidoglycolate lyase
MSKSRILQPEPLTKETFLPFGDVLENKYVEPELINFGNTQKYGRLTDIFIADDYPGQFSIYRSRSIELPFRVRLMERHPLGSQVFYPLHQRPFPVIVAPVESTPSAENIKLFLTNGNQGVNIGPGVWHHYQLSLQQESDYIVVDRVSSGDNYREHQLEEAIFLNL